MASTPVHWSRIGEAGTVMGMKLFLLTFRIFGRSGFQLFLYPVIGYYYLLRKSARQASKQYLQQIRPFLPVEQRSSLSSFRHFMVFGEVLLDKLLVWMGHIDKEDVILVSRDTIEKIDCKRKGGIIIVSHLGNFEVGSALANQIPNMRLTLLIYTRHAEKFNSLMKTVTGNSNMEIIQVSDVSPATIMMLSNRINAGGYVVIAGDRVPVSGQARISMVRFLGKLAPMPQGPFILAGLLKCPVYLMFCLKQHAQYHVYFELFLERLKFGDRKKRLETLDNTVQEYAKRLEYYCLQTPLQWFNFFPFWGDNQVLTTNPIPPVESEADIS